MISDSQVKNLWRLFDKGESIKSSSLKAGINEKTGSKYLNLRKLPSECKTERTWRTRQDPFAKDWEEIKRNFKKSPDKPITTVFKEIQAHRPKSYKNGQLRTLQRKVKGWKKNNNTCPDNISIKSDDFSFIFFIECKKKLFRSMKDRKSYLNILQYINFRNHDFDEKNLVLTDDEQQLVINSRKRGDKFLWKYALSIELDVLGIDITTISYLLDISKKTIRSKLNIFKHSGFEKLLKKNKPAPLKKRTDQKIKRVLEILHQKPSSCGVNRSNWNCESIAKLYSTTYEESISARTVGRLINKAGYKFKKARQVLTSPDPDYNEKVELLLKTIQTLRFDEMFFFIDELGPLRVKKYGGRCFVKNGKTLTTPQNQNRRGSITLSAALSAKTNQVTWLYEKSKDTSSMINLIEILLNQHYNKSKLFITWDAASWHSSNELINWLDKLNNDTPELKDGPSIELIPLPSCSQFLNIIESVFSGMKRAVIHHSNYQSEDEMKTAISKHFQERNTHFIENPKRAGNKIWDINFFKDFNNIKSGNYRDY